MDLIQASKLKDEVSIHFALLEEYDRTFGLMDHRTTSDLSSILELHPEEDPITGSRMLGLIDEIIGSRIPELTGDGLKELLEYPLHVLEHILERGKRIRSSEAKAFSDPKPPNS